MPHYRISYHFGLEKGKSDRERRLRNFTAFVEHLASGVVRRPTGRPERWFESEADLESISSKLASCLALDCDRVFIYDETEKAAVLMGSGDNQKAIETRRREGLGWKVQIR